MHDVLSCLILKDEKTPEIQSFSLVRAWLNRNQLRFKTTDYVKRSDIYVLKNPMFFVKKVISRKSSDSNWKFSSGGAIENFTVIKKHKVHETEG